MSSRVLVARGLSLASYGWLFVFVCLLFYQVVRECKLCDMPRVRRPLTNLDNKNSIFLKACIHSTYTSGMKCDTISMHLCLFVD